MTKKLIKEIEGCLQCDYFQAAPTRCLWSQRDFEHADYYKLLISVKKKVKMSYPDWCPLEDSLSPISTNSTSEKKSVH